MSKAWHFDVLPRDEHNEALLANVRPADWVNPHPEPVYNLVVVGAGTAGLICAAGAAGLGAKVALIERHLMGGDCLNVGCVPSKCLIRSSRAAHEVRQANTFGVTPGNVAPGDFAAVMERLRIIRAGISHHDSAARFRDLGVDMFIGEGRFTGQDTVEVAGQTLRFKKAVIATGARALHPPIPGLEETGFLTNETVFSLTELPRRLAVVGGGPIGCELAQAFRRLGSEVTVIERARFLPREDPDAAAFLAEVFEREGIDVRLCRNIRETRTSENGKQLVAEHKGNEEVIEADEILIGVGRVPNIDGLGLKEAGIEADPRDGIVVDDFLRTTNRRVFSAGDACMAYKFTHAADAAARIVIQNALFWGRARVSKLTIPWCTYTAPEIAHVGLYEAGATSLGIELDTFTVGMGEIDRALADGEGEGFVKVHVKKGTDIILGATIISAHAGETISEISVAMAGNIGLKKMAGVIHPYPTQAEAIKRVADAYSRTRLTPRIKKIFEKLLAWQRR